MKFTGQRNVTKQDDIHKTSRVRLFERDCSMVEEEEFNSGIRRRCSSDTRSYIGDRVARSDAVISGCQMSTMRTRRSSVPSCHTSCSNESSKMMNLPSSHVLPHTHTHTQVKLTHTHTHKSRSHHSRAAQAYLVSLPTRMRGPVGTLRPR